MARAAAKCVRGSGASEAVERATRVARQHRSRARVASRQGGAVATLTAGVDFESERLLHGGVHSRSHGSGSSCRGRRLDVAAGGFGWLRRCISRRLPCESLVAVLDL